MPNTRTITASTGLTGGGDLSANRSLAADFGTGAGKVTQGNDSRLSDARTPIAHKTSHQDGGTDEIVLTGLSGQAADGQRASALLTTVGSVGTDVVVSAAAAPSSGQVLTATGATAATWQTPAASSGTPSNEYWARDTTLTYGSKTDEFTSPVALNAAYRIRAWSTWTTPTAAGAVDSLNAPPSGQYNISLGRRGSWLMLQPNALDIAMSFSFTLASPGHQFRARFTSAVLRDSGVASPTTDGFARLILSKDSGGNPDTAASFFGGFGFFSASPTASLGPTIVGGILGSTTNVVNPSKYGSDGEFIILAFADSPLSGQVTIRIFCRTGLLPVLIFETVLAGTAVGSTMWITLRMGGTTSLAHILGCDYIREYPDLKLLP